MLALSLSRPLAAAATLAAAAALAVAAAAPADSGRAHAAALKRITFQRVGGVHLGDRFRTLRARGLVGPLRHGCELAENTRSARLKAPLEGTVNFTTHNPRRVSDVVVTGGARARRVHVGSRRRAIRRSFPNAKFDHSTDDVFGLTLARVLRSGHDKLQFAVSTKTHRVTLIGLPFIAFCE